MKPNGNDGRNGNDGINTSHSSHASHDPEHYGWADLHGSRLHNPSYLMANQYPSWS